MQLDRDFLERWEQIVNDVDKNHCPIECVKKVVFKTTDRKQKTINLRQLRKQGFNNDSIEQAVSIYISENDGLIASMELVLDVEAVAEIIQPETDKLLKGI
jgi:hypothetical protein